jgi:hypothetical protein
VKGGDHLEDIGIDRMIIVKVRVTLQLTVSQSVSQSVLELSPYVSHDQILLVIKTVVVLFFIEHSPVKRTGL